MGSVLERAEGNVPPGLWMLGGGSGCITTTGVVPPTHPQPMEPTMNTQSGQVAMSSIRLVGGATGGAISCSPTAASMWST